MMTQAQTKPTLAKVLGNANFRLLWIGQGTSLLGDQFFMIAVPWLVLKLTNDPLALGGVLALAGVPRALFMLLGGAVTDRYTPRAIMLISDALRLALVGLLVILVATGSVQTWMLYILALFYGMISGFFVPASNAMMPMIVTPAELQVSNSLYQGTAQLTNFVGPVLAGGLIALLGHSQSAGGTPEMAGITAALGVDDFSFLVSVATLWLMTAGRAGTGQTFRQGNILAAIREGIHYAWQDALMRMFFIMMVVMNLLLVGPLLVGIPVLAKDRLSGGAAAYGLVMGGYGGGNLLGILLAGVILRLFKKQVGVYLVGVTAAFGLALIALGFTTSTAIAFMILLVVGIGNGTLLITLITALQRQTPKEMLGRIMSLAMLAGAGLVPVSQALTGGLLKLSLTGVFLGAGGLVLVAALWLALQPALASTDRIIGREEQGGSQNDR
jgi:MFS family permease